MTNQIVPRLAVATRRATYCLQTHPIGDPAVYSENTTDVIGGGSNTGRGILVIDMVLSLNIHQKCILKNMSVHIVMVSNSLAQ
jgi:hypothetical protein